MRDCSSQKTTRPSGSRSVFFASFSWLVKIKRHRPSLRCRLETALTGAAVRGADEQVMTKYIEDPEKLKVRTSESERGSSSSLTGPPCAAPRHLAWFR